MTIDHPLVSVITATYNRSNVLRYTIASVVRSTVDDWEMIVVGDACTDDTQDVVKSFKDPRIRFYNLSHNVGEQSGPNNEGFKHARGKYIAYLNHDDLWLPDHLEKAVSAVENTGADMVFTLGIAVRPGGPNVLLGAAPGGSYQPHIVVPASCWLLRRGLIEEIGPWRSCREIYNAPSQDWIWRAWRAGRAIRLVPEMTVIAIQSGARTGVYATRAFEENKDYFERMCCDSNFRERELLKIAYDYASETHQLKVWRHVRRAGINILKRATGLLGFSVYTLVSFLRFRRKGGVIDDLRRRRGLPPTI